jgi:LysM repeat protein
MSTTYTRQIVLTALFVIGFILAGCTRSASTPPPEAANASLTEEESSSHATMEAFRATLLAQTEQPVDTEAPTSTPTIELPTSTPTPEGPTETPPVVFNTPTSQAGDEITYIVKAGDSVYSVALAHGISPDDLITRNGLQYPYYLDIGQELMIPAAGSTPTTGGTPAAGTKQHIVQQGEWIYSIARKYGVSPDDIIALNNIPYPYTLYPGDVLNIP